MRRVEDFPEGIGAVVDHCSPVGFDLRNSVVAQPALQQGDNVMMAQVRGIHGNGGRLLLQAAHQRLPLPAVPTSASTSQICDAHETGARRR